MAAAPESDSRPTAPPRGPGSARLNRAFLLDDFAFLAFAPGLGPDGGVPQARP